MIEVRDDGDALLPEGVQDLITDVILNYDNVRLHLGQLLLDNADPVLFLVDDCLDLSQRVVLSGFHSANRFFQ